MIDHVGIPVSDYARARRSTRRPRRWATADDGSHAGADRRRFQCSRLRQGRQARFLDRQRRSSGGILTSPCVAADRDAVRRFYDTALAAGRSGQRRRPVCARITTRIITARSCWIRMATTSRRFATRRLKEDDVRQDPHRQPRRNRLPRDPHLPPPRHPHRRGVFRGRRRCAARAPGRRGVPDRRPAPAGELSARRCDPRSREASPARRRSIPATASSARTPTSPMRWKPRASSSSARARRRCARWAARPAPRN